MDKADWLVRFRRANSKNTLDIMRDAAIRKLENDFRQIADVILAHEKRETEIERGLYCRR